MKAYESMTKKLSPTGIYSLEENGAISNELKTYSTGIDQSDDILDIIIREAFVSTAEDYGLSMWEEMFGGIQSGVDASTRRKLIKGRLQLNYSNFTPSGVKEIINSLGITSYTLTENPALFLVIIDLSAQSYTKTQRKWIKEQLEELLPAHLEISTIFGTVTWNEIDNMSLTADQMDAKNYSWDDIDTIVI